MTDQPDFVTLFSWVSPQDELVEVDVPAELAERIAAGEAAFPRDAEMRRYSGEDGRARLKAQLDQINARMDDLVTEHPRLKSQPRRRRD